MESANAALTDGVSGFMMVEGVSSLSEGGSRIGMIGDRGDNYNGGLGTATLLK